MDGCIQNNPGKPEVGEQGDDAYERISYNLDKDNTQPHMYRWRFNLRTGETKEGPLEDEISEFPVVANEIVSRPYKYTFNALYAPSDWQLAGLKKVDVTNGTSTEYDYGDNCYGSEAVVALRANAKSEDDSYVVTFVTDMNSKTSECLILDAANIEAGPLARIILPLRIVTGTHACWVEAERFHGELAA